MADTPKRLRLELELEPGAEPIAGRLSDETGAHWEFIGWLELATALDEAVLGHKTHGDRSANP